MTRFLGPSVAIGGLAAGLSLVAIAAGAQTTQTPTLEAPTSQTPSAQAPAVTPATAAPTVPGAAPFDPEDPWMWGDVAKLRGLDKVTAETRDFDVRVGEDFEFLALTISVKRCAKRPPERTPEVIVGMEIADRRSDGEGGAGEAERIFAGWMFGSSPALNPLEHPVYDVWVLDCINSLVPVVEPPPAEQGEGDAEEQLDDGPLPGEVFD
jgi:hypothetical protein